MRLLENDWFSWNDVDWIVENYRLDDFTKVHREIYDKKEGGWADDAYDEYKEKKGNDILAVLKEQDGLYNMFRLMALDYDMYFSTFDLESVDSDIADVLSNDDDDNDVESHVQLYNEIDTPEVRQEFEDSFIDVYMENYPDFDEEKEEFLNTLDGLCESNIRDIVDGIVEDIFQGKPWVGKIDKSKSDMSVSMYYYVTLAGQKDDEPETLDIRVSDHGNKHGEESVEMSLFDDNGDPLDEADFQNILTDMVSDWLSQNTSLEF